MGEGLSYPAIILSGKAGSQTDDLSERGVALLRHGHTARVQFGSLQDFNSEKLPDTARQHRIRREYVTVIEWEDQPERAFVPN